MIRAEIVADSLSPQGDRLISVLATFPRIILAEVNTHRMLSKNTSSSRAIPFEKMVEAIRTNPFIPIAWQKDHKGMQGTEYLSGTEQTQIWLRMKDNAINEAILLSECDTTKQLCNRPLETFMWTTMLITGPFEGGWDNFFDLRCPQYQDTFGNFYRSRKDFNVACFDGKDWNEIDWLKANKGQAEIHMMALAECIWDSINESTPKELLAGEWHLPFKDKIDSLNIEATIKSVNNNEHYNSIPLYAKISTAMAARTSYTIVGEEKEIDYVKMVELHDKLIAQNPPHSSPMEHCAKAMNDVDYETHVKGLVPSTVRTGSLKGLTSIPLAAKGWCRNFKGFIPYRHIVESKNN
jgi:hypothetical protein